MTPMRFYIALILAAELAMSLFMSCSGPAARTQPEITGPFQLVQFPEPWIKSKNGAMVGVNDAVQYVVRKLENGNRSQLLFAVKQGFDGTLYGKEVSDFPVAVSGLRLLQRQSFLCHS